MGWYIFNYPRTPFLDVLFFYPTFPKWKGTSKDTIQPKVFVTSWTETWRRLFCILAFTGTQTCNCNHFLYPSSICVHFSLCSFYRGMIMESESAIRYWIFTASIHSNHLQQPWEKMWKWFSVQTWYSLYMPQSTQTHKHGIHNTCHHQQQPWDHWVSVV